MRVIFMGTPEFAVPTLLALHEAGHDIPAVYTQPPRPAGRGKASASRLCSSPPKASASRRAIRSPCAISRRRPISSRSSPMLAVVVAYGLILPSRSSTRPKHGCLNVHASLLPRWRGAAPIQRAILAGDHVTGVTIMRMEEGLDTGPMLATARVPVEDKTSGELHAELAEIGARLLVETLAQLDQLKPEPQPDARRDLRRQDRQGRGADRLGRSRPS